MSKTLIIAEKPSVAGDIARALGGFTKKEDFFESDEFVITSAVGHLLEICPPAGVEPTRGKWSLANLPVLPQKFDLKPYTKTESRLKLLTRLLKRKDIVAVINACDAGREGELIFRYIIQYSGSKLPVRRLWLQSMTAGAIREGFEHLRSDAEMLPLADAAICRSEADWLVGINGTRAMTAFNSREGGFQKTTVGRVQTPTLFMIVEREEKIKGFVSRPYYELYGTFSCHSGEYQGIWFDDAFVKDSLDKDKKAERIWNLEQAQAIRRECLGQRGTVTQESKKKMELSPLLFDLTSLQREANQRFGFSARRTLTLAQALYERHKVLTYPRTDSRALPEDYLGTVRSTMNSLKETEFAPFADQILKSSWIRPNKRIFNNAKISDHFAIIPTGHIKRLEGDEAKIYDLVTRRFLAVFFPAAEYLITTYITRVLKHHFRSEGKILVQAGWTAIYGKAAAEDPSLPSLVPVEKGEEVETKEVELKACETRPPARFTEATLLSAMETAGKFVEDEDLREAMSEKGLGTPATRASIIEGLLEESYLQRVEKGALLPTMKAFDLITLLRGLKLPELCSPELTGDWEFKLKQIEHRQMDRGEFMQMIRGMTSDIVDKVRGFKDEIRGSYSFIEAPCPKCGGKILEEYRKFNCQNCDFSLWKTIAGRRLTGEEVSELFSHGIVGPLDGFVSRMGRAFSASLKWNSQEGKVDFDFGQDNTSDEKKTVNLEELTPIGKCPLCGANVYETDSAYLCENAYKPAARGKKKCSFRTGKVVLGQEISFEQAQKLLKEGKTDLLENFFSEKKKKQFSAYLSVKPNRGVVFEFLPREKKTTSRAKSGTSSKTKIQRKKTTDKASAEE